MCRLKGAGCRHPETAKSLATGPMSWLSARCPARRHGQGTASSGDSLLALKVVCQAQERRPIPSVSGSPSFCQPLCGSLGAVKIPSTAQCSRAMGPNIHQLPPPQAMPQRRPDWSQNEGLQRGIAALKQETVTSYRGFRRQHHMLCEMWRKKAICSGVLQRGQHVQRVGTSGHDDDPCLEPLNPGQ